MDLSFMPTVNAGLNALAAMLLIVGLYLIRQRRITAHRNVMMSAFGISIVFLIGYVAHKAWKASTGADLHTTYDAEGAARIAYLIILFTHLVLAMIVPFLAVALIALGLKKRYQAHRRIARYAWPMWMYVSVTGVVIYLMLYHFNPGN